MGLKLHNIAFSKRVKPYGIVKVITDYDYIYNVIDYDCDYIASENADYDYNCLRSCN